MGVEVLIKRKIVAAKVAEVASLMVKLRSLARGQAGYISSESLICIDPPVNDEYLVRSTWRSIEDWRRWLNSDERQAFRNRSTR
jgi:heme-degrading monooxygenase HmoA